MSGNVGYALFEIARLDNLLVMHCILCVEVVIPVDAQDRVSRRAFRTILDSSQKSDTASLY